MEQLTVAAGNENPNHPPNVPALLRPQSPQPPSVLADADYAAAAGTLHCEVAVIKAVATVETGQSPFDAQGRPAILFERRYFSRLTGHIYDATHPEISSMAKAGYGTQASQYPKLLAAAALDLDNALRSASWGAFQIMGDNCKLAGFATPELMVAAMRSGVAAHLAAFVSFIQADPRLIAAVQAKDWPSFAAVYNGPGTNGAGTQGYTEKLAAAYAANS